MAKRQPMFFLQIPLTESSTMRNGKDIAEALHKLANDLPTIERDYQTITAPIKDRNGKAIGTCTIVFPDTLW